jgi:Divergent InlB B-repeat domain
MVTGSAQARFSQARRAEPARQAIRCGVRGINCFSEVAPGEPVTMRAQPDNGYRFAGWTGACTSLSPICQIKNGSGTVSAKFVPKNARRIIAISLRPRIKARFTASIGKGRLTVNGSITSGALLRVQLRRPGGGPLLNRKLRVFGGPFGLRAALRKGTLLRGARLFPGTFVLSLRGRSGLAAVPLQLRTIFVKSPNQGVVRRSYASTTSAGRALRTLPRRTPQAWAIFRFATQPIIGPVTVSWIQPNGTLLGTVEKSNRPILRTGIASGPGVPSGTWKVVLRAGGKLIKTQRVRVR